MHAPARPSTPVTSVPFGRRRSGRSRFATPGLPTAADELVESALQCLLAARQELDELDGPGRDAALAALRTDVDEALASLYAIPARPSPPAAG